MSLQEAPTEENWPWQPAVEFGGYPWEQRQPAPFLRPFRLRSVPSTRRVGRHRAETSG